MQVELPAVDCGVDASGDDVIRTRLDDVDPERALLSGVNTTVAPPVMAAQGGKTECGGAATAKTRDVCSGMAEVDLCACVERTLLDRFEDL